MHVVETGNPRGRSIVFIHGLSQCWLQWSRQMNSSLIKDHRLFLESDIDVKGRAYEEIVGSNLRGDRGEFFTPRNICRMAVEMLVRARIS